jgi:hypothetical protein
VVLSLMSPNSPVTVAAATTPTVLSVPVTQAAVTTELVLFIDPIPGRS